MSREVLWTRRVVQLFEQAASLTEIEKQVLQTRVAGMTITQQAFYLSMSERTIGRIIQRLKQKYDAVQAEYPDDLKPRRSSAEENYLDTH